ncbi:coronatine-insensitive protein 1-like [Rutidosis leptorrhynchoides]|uniref:coronatine-insensitive protein 1-like n=1 Tax=Rutidosis leptorrhynchoides TaxID=125765 RepID=UPI003A9963CF
MEDNNHHNNIHTIIDCIAPYINDRNTFSLICRRSYDADCKTREHVTVYTRYATSPSRLCQRFPFLQSLTLDGSSEQMHDDDVNIITQWELGTGIEKLYFDGVDYDLKDLEFVAKNCGDNLVSVKIDERYDYIDLVGFFSYAVNLVEFVGGKFSNQLKDEYKSFKFPDSLKHLLIRRTIAVEFFAPFAHLITELDFPIHYGPGDFELIKSCHNLKVLHLPYDISDQELQDTVIYCKNLRKLYIEDDFYAIVSRVSHNGVIHIAKHCIELECLHIIVVSMTDEVMSYIGKNMKKLKVFSLHMWMEKNETALDNGVRSLLIGCDKLEKLSIRGGWLTDKGFGFIGKHGCNLRYLNLEGINVKESDAGVIELSKLGYQCQPNCFSKEAINISGRNVKGIPQPQPCRDIEQV